METIYKTRIRKLIEALESGNYPKGKGQLKSLDGKFCCQGVGCELVNADVHTDILIPVETKMYENHGDECFCGYCENAPEYIFYGDDYTRWPVSVENYYGLNDGQSEALIELNDENDTFIEVISYLEELIK